MRKSYDKRRGVRRVMGEGTDGMCTDSMVSVRPVRIISTITTLNLLKGTLWVVQS